MGKLDSLLQITGFRDDNDAANQAPEEGQISLLDQALINMGFKPDTSAPEAPEALNLAVNKDAQQLDGTQSRFRIGLHAVLIATGFRDEEQAVSSQEETQASDETEALEADASLDNLEYEDLTGQTIEIQEATYEIIKLLGRGGFGVTYLAKAENGDDVIVKQLWKLEGQEEMLTNSAYARRDIDVSLDILANYIGVDLGKGYVVTSFAEGKSLFSHCREMAEQAESLSEAALKAVPLIYAAVKHSLRNLERVHLFDRVHGDVSPYNIILLVRDERIIKATLADLDTFTIAGTKYSMLAGLPLCIAPEVLKTHKPVPESDIYALGMTTAIALGWFCDAVLKHVSKDQEELFKQKLHKKGLAPTNIKEIVESFPEAVQKQVHELLTFIRLATQTKVKNRPLDLEECMQALAGHHSSGVSLRDKALIAMGFKGTDDQSSAINEEEIGTGTSQDAGIRIGEKLYDPRVVTQVTQAIRLHESFRVPITEPLIASSDEVNAEDFTELILEHELWKNDKLTGLFGKHHDALTAWEAVTEAIDEMSEKQGEEYEGMLEGQERLAHRVMFLNARIAVQKTKKVIADISVKFPQHIQRLVVILKDGESDQELYRALNDAIRLSGKYRDNLLLPSDIVVGFQPYFDLLDDLVAKLRERLVGEGTQSTENLYVLPWEHVQQRMEGNSSGLGLANLNQVLDAHPQAADVIEFIQEAYCKYARYLQLVERRREGYRAQFSTEERGKAGISTLSNDEYHARIDEMMTENKEALNKALLALEGLDVTRSRAFELMKNAYEIDMWGIDLHTDLSIFDRTYANRTEEEIRQEICGANSELDERSCRDAL